MLPVVDDDGRYHGCITARDVAEALDGDSPPETVAQVSNLPPTLTVDAGPPEVLAALAGHERNGVPVLDRARTELVGWLTYQQGLAVLHPNIPDGKAAT